jgi:hypothetical protein
MGSIELKVQALHFELFDEWSSLFYLCVFEVGLPSEAYLSIEYYIGACRRSHQ